MITRRQIHSITSALPNVEMEELLTIRRLAMIEIVKKKRGPNRLHSSTTIAMKACGAADGVIDAFANQT